ncbi:MAG: hypothetical protein B6D76_15800 [gamma proteobacterium symbiont of Stewartia floridana]|nr:MAG: hypothetical protein B6D76_15800 [gamma proteobacterium symbiont of Stewartia floridana]RLW58397.1 MAG: hypothetical protein B6D75_13450 [gamma proteobacterium symbiont of Stewartia floridana]
MSFLILIGGIAIMIIGVSILASLWRGGDFAIALFLGCIYVIMVNLIFASENRLTDKAEFNADNNLDDSDGL